MALLEGIKVNLGGREFTVPPLTIKALRILGPRFGELQQALESGNLVQVFAGDKLDTIVDVAHAAIERNHPEVTRDELEGLIDMTNMGPLFMAICGQSALQERPAGEAPGPRRKR